MAEKPKPAAFTIHGNISVKRIFDVDGRSSLVKNDGNLFDTYGQDLA